MKTTINVVATLLILLGIVLLFLGFATFTTPEEVTSWPFYQHLTNVYPDSDWGVLIYDVLLFFMFGSIFFGLGFAALVANNQPRYY